MTTRLRVYVPLDNPNCDSEITENAQRAINLFQGEAPSGLEVIVKSFAPQRYSDYDQDFMTVREALENSREEDYDAYVVICKDTCISSASSQTILSTVYEVIRRDQDCADTSFDLYYMAKWFDSCHLYTNQCELEGRGIFIADTFDARGIQCLMFSPRGIDKFLKLNTCKRGHQLSNVLRNRLVSRTSIPEDYDCEEVEEKDIKFVAVTTYPAQIHFDIRYATNDHDYAKTQACAPVCGPEKPSKGSTNINVFIFVAIFLIIAVGIYFLVKYGLAMSNAVAEGGSLELAMKTGA